MIDILLSLSLLFNVIFMVLTVRRQNFHWEYMQSMSRQMDLMACALRKVILEQEARNDVA